MVGVLLGTGLGVWVGVSVGVGVDVSVGVNVGVTVGVSVGIKLRTNGTELRLQLLMAKVAIMNVNFSKWFMIFTSALYRLYDET